MHAGAAGREIGVGSLRDERPELLIDALSGYGLSAPPHGITAELIAWANDSATPILSLDVPSGVDATTGATRGVAIRPRWTMTLALPKTGLRRDNGGQLVLADVAIPTATFRRAGLASISPFGDRFRIPLTIA